MPGCEICCSERQRSILISGRVVHLCSECLGVHLDFPKLAASLEAAKGRKCIDPDCEAHAASWGRGIEELRKEQAAKDAEAPGWLEKTNKEVEAMHKRIVKSLSETMVPRVQEPGDLAKAYAAAGTPADLSSVNAALALPAEPKLCVCGHPVRDHWKDCGGCWKVIPGKITDSGNCDCEQFAEATRLCTCGHPLGWHYPKAPTRCGWQENKGAPDCLCERFTEAIGWRKEAAATPFGREQLAHLCACGHPPVCHYESSGPCNLSTCTCGKFAEAIYQETCGNAAINGLCCLRFVGHSGAHENGQHCWLNETEAPNAKAS